ncbi:hypothetical protein Dimus_020544 [Dionaea muscipula]
MESAPTSNSWARGFVLQTYMVCQYEQLGSKMGFWHFGVGVGVGEPVASPTQLLMIHLSLIFIVTRLVYFCLQPLHQSMTIAQIVAGIVIGPSFLTRSTEISTELFPPSAQYVLKTISTFGCMLHLFIHGVKIDVASLWKGIEGKAVFIGLSGFFVSLALGGWAFKIVKGLGGFDSSQGLGIILLVILNSMTFFTVTTSYLNDMKISNSEVGALASSSSFVLDAFGYFSFLVLQGLDTHGILFAHITKWTWFLILILYYCTLFFVLRPLIVFIVRLTPEKEAMKRSHFMAILCIVLVAWFWGECLGQRMSTFLFGLSLPDGPPLGSILVQKLEVFTSGLLLPVFCTASGLRTNLYHLKDSGTTSTWALELIIVACRIGKFLGTLLAAIFVNVPVQKSIPLALIMCCQGIMEVIVLSYWKDQMLLDIQLFSMALINVVISTGMLLPLVQHIYDPSRGYEAYNRKSVLGLGSNATGDLLLLVCIHKEENVPTVIDLLAALESSTAGSVSIIDLQLVQLTGRATPILGPLHQARKSSLNLNQADQIANAFRYFERHSKGYVNVQHFISATPYSSMHNDVCLLAHDKRANLIIIPFHKQWAIDGTVGASSLHIRELNRLILTKAPCSVAVLVDREPLGSTHSILKGKSSYNVVVLFIGGADDHEALAIAGCMANHPNVNLTVIWLKSEAHVDDHRDFNYHSNHKSLDVEGELIRDFHFRMKDNENVTLCERIVSDGIGTTKAVISAQNADLFIVGRYHEPDCPATLGIAMWSDYPELGMLGDMLTSTLEFQFSVLVVQQQPRLDLSYGGSRNARQEDVFGMSSAKRLTGFGSAPRNGIFGRLSS